MTRKNYFLLAVASSAVSHLYFRTASESAMRFIFHCVFMGFMLPGNVSCLLLERIIPLPFHVYIAVTSLISVLVWFFPANRIRRWFGTFDAVSGDGKHHFPSLTGYAARVLDTVRRWQVGKGKSGGWA